MSPSYPPPIGLKNEKHPDLGACVPGSLFRLAFEAFVEKIVSWMGFERWGRGGGRAS